MFYNLLLYTFIYNYLCSLILYLYCLLYVIFIYFSFFNMLIIISRHLMIAWWQNVLILYNFANGFCSPIGRLAAAGRHQRLHLRHKLQRSQKQTPTGSSTHTQETTRASQRRQLSAAGWLPCGQSWRRARRGHRQHHTWVLHISEANGQQTLRQHLTAGRTKHSLDDEDVALDPVRLPGS